MGLISKAANAVGNAAKTVGKTVERGVEKAKDTVEKASKDVEEAAKDVVDSVGDAVNDAAESVQGAFESANEWMCKNAGKILCAGATLVFGGLSGVVESMQVLANDVLDVARSVIGALGSLSRFDVSGFVEGLLQLGTDLLEFGADVLRVGTGGYVIGGVFEHRRRFDLVRFVDDYVDRNFEGEERERIREEVGLNSGKRFGFRLPAEHRVLTLDSDHVDLVGMHRRQTIDLYEMAGLASPRSGGVEQNHPNAEVVLVDDDGNDTSRTVGSEAIRAHLRSDGEANRLRVYPMSHRVAVRRMATASKKLEEMAIILQWNDGPERSGYRDDTRVLAQTSEEYDIEVTNSNTNAILKRGFGRGPDEQCWLPVLGAFDLSIPKRRGANTGTQEAFGYTVGRSLVDGPEGMENCPDRYRTDECCAQVVTQYTDGRTHPLRSGVFYRDLVPRNFYKYVLAHEIGHYVGLCHYGHSGAQYVMYTLKEYGPLDPGLVSFYVDDEPHFTQHDGSNAWMFLLEELGTCVGASGSQSSGTSGTTTRRFPISPGVA
jgi:hypothetical protein